MIPQKKQSDDQLHIQKFSRHFHKQEINKHKVEKCKPCGFYYETKVDPLWSRNGTYYPAFDNLSNIVHSTWISTWL